MLLSGEAGIGKSRLTAALARSHRVRAAYVRLRNFCSPQHTDSALYPTIRQIERAAGFTRDDTSQAKLDKLDALLAQSSTSASDAALFAEMLSLPNDGRYPALELTPQQRRQRTLEALVSQMEALVTSKSGADDLRGCTLGRPHEPRTVRSHRGQITNAPRAADHDVPSGVRAALDWTTLCDCSHHQSAGGARSQRDD